jgi:hypothetical protein
MQDLIEVSNVRPMKIFGNALSDPAIKKLGLPLARSLFQANQLGAADRTSPLPFKQRAELQVNKLTHALTGVLASLNTLPGPIP